jgi:putative tryptophan/tyrosine transport system substrate-binding protein
MRLIGLAVVLALAVSLLLAPILAEAQEARRVRVGWLAPEPKSFALDPFLHAMKELGWTEGGNLVIERRYARDAAETYRQLVADLIQLRVDAIVADGSPATRAAQQATAAIPIVFLASSVIQRGFADTLSRPGKNLTGLEIIAADLNPKRIQFLKEAVPGMARLAVLQDESSLAVVPTSISLPGNREALEAAARQTGVQLRPLRVRKLDDLNGAFASAVKDRAEGILVLPSPSFTTRIQRIVTLAESSRLPAMYEHREFVEMGGLMSYGPNHGDMFRRLAMYVDRILKGARPADLPVEQPTKFELVINLKTAKSLGLTIPQTLQLRADQVIQ